jgi:hypothetical protein
LEKEPFSSAYSLAEALDVSPVTVLSRLHNSLGMKIFHLRWVPHQLTDVLRQVRVAKCGELLRALEAMQRTHFRHVITDDENWCYLEYQHASQWLVSGDEVPQRVDPAIGTTRFMITAISGVNGFRLRDLMPSQCRLNAQYFVEHVMAPLAQDYLAPCAIAKKLTTAGCKRQPFRFGRNSQHLSISSNQKLSLTRVLFSSVRTERIPHSSTLPAQGLSPRDYRI